MRAVIGGGVVMRKTFTLAFIFALTVIGGETARAEDRSTFNADPRLFSIGPSVGTLGVGLEASYKLSNNFVLRAQGSYGKIDGLSFGLGGAGSNGDERNSITISNGAALVDWHPFQSGFRFSAGGRYVDFEDVNVDEPSFGSVWIGGQSFSTAHVGAVTRTVAHNGVIGGYAGVGYDASLFTKETNWVFSIDMGVIFLQEAEVDVKTERSGAPGLEAATEEEIEDMKNDAEFLQTLPVFMFNGKYRF